MGTKTTRIDKWDNLKLVLIVLVVIGHLMKSQLDVSRTARIIYWFIYLFHMPAFIIASGMFAKRSIRERRYDRAFMFLVLYFLIKFSMFLFKLINQERISMSLFKASGIEWYAFALFAYYLFTMFMQRFDWKYVFILAVVFGCASGYDTSLGDRFVLARINTFYPFFLLGFYLESDKVIAFTSKKWFKAVAAAALVLAALISFFYIDDVFWTVDLFKGNKSYRVIARDIRSFAALIRLGQYLISALLTFSLLALVPSKKLPVSWIGRQTLPIYALHYILIDLFNEIFGGTEYLQSISPKYYEFLLIPVGIVMVLILSTKPFVTLVNKIIMPRPAKTEEHKTAS